MDFVNDNSKKRSFSASFGSDRISKNYLPIITKNLQLFKYVSVREANIIEMINNIPLKIQNILDPVFLLTAKEWEQLFHLKNYNSKILLLYINGFASIDLVNYIKSNYSNYELICLNNTSIFIDGFKNLFHTSPVDWLNLIFNAEIVVTNSYHGCLFTILFNKALIYTYSTTNVNYNCRFFNIVDVLKLFGQNLKLSKDEKLYISNFDYKIIDQALKKNKDISINYLKTILKD